RLLGYFVPAHLLTFMKSTSEINLLRLSIVQNAPEYWAFCLQYRTRTPVGHFAKECAMQPKSKKKLQLARETLRTLTLLNSGALGKIVGGVSIATLCNSKDIQCHVTTQDGGATCNDTAQDPCNSGAGVGTCTCATLATCTCAC